MMSSRLPRTLLLGACVLAAAAALYEARRPTATMIALLAPGGRSSLMVPPGFRAGIFAEGLSAPRFLAFAPDGRLVVAEGGRDRLLVVADTDGDGVSDTRSVLADALPSVHSVVWQQGAWYAGVPTGVIELKDGDGDGRAEQRRVLVDDYPTPGHSTRTVLFLPDGRMLVSVGSSCNVCEEDDPRRATIVAYGGAAAGGHKIFARGLRNAVGLALHPVTGQLWATNNGRDWLGDDLPPDTVNIVAEGDDFGWPRCHAGDLVDPDFGGDAGCRGVAAPALKLPAHSAPLGLAFAASSSFPVEYREDLFVAFHGSWNRSTPTGFKVVRVRVRDGRPTGEVEDFVTGFVDPGSGRVLGRPVGLAFGADGALYVSDDKSGFVYRIAAERP
jgi:glucose/arabinose dehydrogenase